MKAYMILVAFIFICWCVTKGGCLVCKIGKGKEKRWNLFLVLSFFAAFLLAALRSDSVGADTWNYIRYYGCVGDLNWGGLLDGTWEHNFFTTEKGYMILEKLCSDLGIPAQLFLAMGAGIFIYGVYRLAVCYAEKHLLLAVCCFLAVGGYLLALNAMRQGIGIGICCLAWCELKSGHTKRFITEVLLACTMHISCAVFFIAFLFDRIPASKKIATLALTVSLVFGAAGAEAMTYILRLFPMYENRYGVGIWKINEANGIILVWIASVLIILLTIFLKDWKKKENHVDFEILLWGMCYVCINMIGLSFDGAQRLAFAFSPFLVLLFARSCLLLKGKVRYFYSAGLTLCMLLVFFKAASTPQYVYTWIGG